MKKDMEKLNLVVEDQSWEVRVKGELVGAFNTFRDAAYHDMIHYPDSKDVEIHRVVVLTERVY